LDIIAHAIDSGTEEQLSAALANANLTGYAAIDAQSTAVNTGGGFNLAAGAMTTAGSTGASTGTYGTSTAQAWIKIALRPARSPFLFSRGSVGGSTVDLTGLNWPTHATGDLGILITECHGDGTFGTPTGGWTQFPNSPQGTGTGAGTKLSAWWKRAASGSESSVNISNTGNHIIAAIHVWRNVVASGNPYTVTSGGVKASASTALSVPGVTTTDDFQKIVYIASRDNDSAAATFSNWANASLGVVLELFDAGSAIGDGGGWGIASGILAAAGASGTMTADIGVSVVNAFMCIALTSGAAPAAGGRSFAYIMG
jgi:hypothetical protein